MIKGRYADLVIQGNKKCQAAFVLSHKLRFPEDRRISTRSMDFRPGLIVLLCFIGFISAIPVKFMDCGSTSGKVVSTVITPCTQEPCELKRGESYSVNVTFISSVESKESKALVHGIIAGVPVPFPIPNSDGCKSGIQCPIHTQQTYHYANTLAVKKEYPALKLVVKWELQDDSGKDLFCIEFPVHLE